MTEPEFAPRAGAPFALAEDLRLLLAPNPSPMTERGTNTYLLGHGAVTVIDPGPLDHAHLAAISAALAPSERITQILVTHSHKDHSPAARALAEATGAPILAFGDSQAGRSDRMQALSGAEIGGGEGVDVGFTCDENLPDRTVIEAGDKELTAIHTPGHLGNHLCFQWGKTLFSGDHIMGWAPSLVSPPEGDLTDFMASLDRVEALGPLRYYPGHGAPIADGLARTQALRAHRLGREMSIRAAVAQGATTLDAITETVYTDVPAALLPAAARNVLAHLIDLEARGLVGFDGPLGPELHVFAEKSQ